MLPVHFKITMEKSKKEKKNSSNPYSVLLLHPAKLIYIRNIKYKKNSLIGRVNLDC